MQAIPSALHIFSNIVVEEIAWCAGSASNTFAVLATTGQVSVCSIDGSRREVGEVSAKASSGKRM